MKIYSMRALVLISGASAIAMAAPAVAQSAGASAAPAAAPQEGISEIIVTAQKREESINKVGMSITAATGDALLQRGISTPADLARLVPSFQATTTTLDTPVYTLRGVGFYDSSLGGSPTVSVYVDQVPLPYPIMTTGAALDLARVEVLKGPQGTIFGQNATGGAINYIAAKPTNTLEAGGTFSFSRFALFEGQGYISGPLTDTLKFRLAVATTDGGAWQRSYTRDAKLGQKDKAQARLLLDWTPTEKLHVELNLSGNYDNSDTAAGQLIAVEPGNPANAYPALTNYPVAPANARAADWDPGQPFKRHNRFFQLSGRVDYDLSDTATLTSITSYARQTVNSLVDADGLALQSTTWQNNGDINSFFQEIRVKNDFGPVKVTLGANYQNDKIYDGNLIFVDQSTTRTTLGLPTPDGLNFTDQTNAQWAVFGNTDVRLGEKLTLQAGLRYTDNRRGLNGCSADPGDGDLAAVYNVLMTVFHGAGNFTPVQPGGCGTLNAVTLQSGLVTDHLDQTNVSWRVGANWQQTRDLLLYFNVSQGYKSGSFPTLSASLDTQYAPAVQERLLAFEGGFKAALAEHRVQLNAAAFYYDYTNKQVLGTSPDFLFGLLPKLVNIPKSQIYGAEAQIILAPVKGLTISGSGTYLHSKITDDFINYDPNAVEDNFKGEALPRSPTWSGVADAEYKFAAGSSLTAFLGGNLTYQSSTNSALGALSQYQLNAYTLLDARAGVESADGRWRVTLFGRNLTNRYYWTNVFRTYDSVIKYAAMPVTYGIQLTVKTR
jgi:outer membrane receptor protein involved in Fe transport